MPDLIPITVALGLTTGVGTMDVPAPAGPPPVIELPPVPVVLNLTPGIGAFVPGTTDPGTVEPVSINLPALTVSTTLPPLAAASSGLRLVLPALNAVLGTGNPSFFVGLTIAEPDQDRDYTVEVQYATDGRFADATTVSKTIDGAETAALLQPTSPVPATVFWRARLLYGGAEYLPWTAASRFTTSTTVTPTTLKVTWTVSASAERPIHLWHLNPAGPQIGDSVTAYGQGFPSSGTLVFGTDTLPVTSWRKVTPSDLATGDDRIINGSVVDPEHYEVVFTAPAYNGPGAALSVEA